jgi:hypothetical protein
VLDGVADDAYDVIADEISARVETGPPLHDPQAGTARSSSSGLEIRDWWIRFATRGFEASAAG